MITCLAVASAFIMKIPVVNDFLNQATTDKSRKAYISNPKVDDIYQYDFRAMMRHATDGYFKDAGVIKEFNSYATDVTDSSMKLIKINNDVLTFAMGSMVGSSNVISKGVGITFDEKNPVDFNKKTLENYFDKGCISIRKR
jgi:hypothetical protein